jgi:teichuronic acid biosynthesis glycosyltransferase TuaC
LNELCRINQVRDPVIHSMNGPIRILTFSTLYPNAVQGTHGIFVENRLRHLVASNRVSARVVAPVPWFPFRGAAFGRYGQLAKVPSREIRFGVDIVHPRYPVLPKIGMSSAPLSLYAFLKPVLARLINNGWDFDLLDAHYFFPDGVAAVMLGRAFGKPVTITARGTDINLIPRYPVPRRMIRWAAERADGLITVCAALKDELVRLGIPPERVRTLRNGVDLEIFRPIHPQQARSTLAVRGPVLASVGSLIERKGHDLVIRALEHLPDVTLLIAGEGLERASLARLAAATGVAGRVHFLGSIPHERLREIYSAADALVLASSREGWPNVLLESMACGTPVIASNVWGAPEIIKAPEAGVLLQSRTASGIASAAKALLAALPPREATRAYAERFSWQETTEGQVDLFSQILRSASPVMSVSLS